MALKTGPSPIFSDVPQMGQIGGWGQRSAPRIEKKAPHLADEEKVKAITIVVFPGMKVACLGLL